MTTREMVRLAREAATAKKARDVVAIDLRRRSAMADYFVICEGDTDRQTRAIADGVEVALREKGVRPFNVSGEKDGSWILLDYIVLIVHVFLPGEREFYDLESLWTAEPMTELAETRARAAKTGTGATRARRRTA